MVSKTTTSFALSIIFVFVIFIKVNAQDYNSTVTFISQSLDNVEIIISPYELGTSSNKIYPKTVEFKISNSPYKTSFKINSLAFVRVSVKKFKGIFPIFFIQPGDNIEFNLELINGNLQYFVNGNELNNSLTKWNKNIAPYYEAQMESKYYNQRLEFVRKFQDSQFSAFLLAGDLEGIMRFKPDTLRKYSNYLSDYALSGYHGKIIKNQIAELSKIQVGMNLYGTTIDSLLSLSKHKGNYIIIDFWATWCGSCVKELPELKSAYNKYKSKAHFISVSADKNKQKWERFIKSRDMNWEQVLDSSIIAQEMGVNIYPTKFIIDTNGIVKQIYVGDYPEFYEELDLYISKKR